MSFMSRRLPGGLFPRLVAFFPFLFPLYVVQGVFLGMPLSLPEVFLSALFFYFLFEHETFRFSEWKLHPVLLFLLSMAVLIVLGFNDSLVLLKVWVLFPALFFVLARSVFREKASMILLSQRAVLISAFFLALFLLWAGFSSDSEVLFSQTLGALGSLPALTLNLAPAAVLAFFLILHPRSKADFWFGTAALVLCLSALVFIEAYGALFILFLVGLLHAVMRQRSKGRLFFALIFMLLILTGAGLFFSIEQGFLSVQLPEGLELEPSLLLCLGLIGFSVLWMASRALLWIGERDAQHRFAVAYALLCFLLILCFSLPFLTVSHLFFFWFFMAILL